MRKIEELHDAATELYGDGIVKHAVKFYGESARLIFLRRVYNRYNGSISS